MELYINNEKIDFELIHEKTLYDITQALQEEFKKTDGQILSINLNEEMLLTPEEQWKDIAVENIHTLRIEAESSKIANIKLLQSVRQYLDIIELAIDDSSLIPEIDKTDIQDILQHIDFLCTGDKEKKYHAIQMLLSNAFKSIGVFDNTHKFKKNEYTTFIFTHTKHIISQRMLMLIGTQHYWVHINKLVDMHIPTLHQIVSFIHESKELMAVNLLISNIDFFIQWINTIHTLPSESIQPLSIEEWNAMQKQYTEQLTDFFEELGQSLEAKDWITISDLIEYEIIPLASEYCQTIANFYPNNK